MTFLLLCDSGWATSLTSRINEMTTHTHTHTPLSRLIRGFRNKYHHSREWHRMTRNTGPDCAVIYVQFNKYTHTRATRKQRGGAQDTQGSSKSCV